MKQLNLFSFFVWLAMPLAFSQAQWTATPQTLAIDSLKPEWCTFWQVSADPTQYVYLSCT